MQKVLIVNNKSKSIGDLVALVSNLSKDIEVLSPEELNSVEVIDSIYDLVILSGGGINPANDISNYYSKELKLITDSHIPIIGICYGFQLICKAYGADIRKLDSPLSKKIVTIRPQNNFLIQDNKINSFEVYESHHWSVVDVNESELEILADSVHGIEMVRHKTKSQFGFQFHPECLMDKTFGDEIFQQVSSNLGI